MNYQQTKQPYYNHMVPTVWNSSVLLAVGIIQTSLPQMMKTSNCSVIQKQQFITNQQPVCLTFQAQDSLKSVCDPLKVHLNFQKGNMEGQSSLNLNLQGRNNEQINNVKEVDKFQEQAFEETEMESKQFSVIDDKMQMKKTDMDLTSLVDDSSFKWQKIKQLIVKYHEEMKKNRKKGNLERKQHAQVKEQIMHTLIDQYRLNQLAKPKKTKVIQQNSKNSKMEEYNFRCCRKLCRILHFRGLSRTESYDLGRKMLTVVQFRSKGILKHFKLLYLQLMNHVKNMEIQNLLDGHQLYQLCDKS